MEKIKSFPPSEEDISSINQYTQREFSPSELYTFTVRLCDNEIDRDCERFTKEALEALAPLFLGKTGILDHAPSAKNQAARIYATWVEKEDRLTSAGEPYCSLKAKAYMIRGGESDGLIAEIEGGIKKEVSVGCGIGEIRCSICGEDVRQGCPHEKGKSYDGKLCHHVLSSPTDAYEWSFVAVPAQPAAGVVKHYLPDSEEAAAGRAYLKELREEVVRLSYLTEAPIEADIMASITGKLSLQELKALQKAFRQRLERDALAPQLVPSGEKREELRDYCV